jgi:membrane-associated phospholipid phosphatase
LPTEYRAGSEPQLTPARVRAGDPPWWIALAAIVVLVAVTLDVLHTGRLTRVDHEVSREMVRWNLRHSAVKPLIYAFTLFGQRGTVLGVSGPVVLFLCWRARSIRPAVLYVLALVLIFVVVYGLKSWTERTAPPLDTLHVASGASYPSGHLVNAFVVWWLVAGLASHVPLELWARRLLAGIAWFGPVSVIISMTLLDYHWVTDFVGALCVGLFLRYALVRVGRLLMPVAPGS